MTWKSRSKRIGIILASLVLAAVLIYWLFFRGGQGSENVLRLAGHIEATETDLSFKVPGKISLIHFQEGDWIKAGQVVAQLEAEDLRDQVAVVEGRVAAAEANLTKLLAGSRPQEKREALAAVERAQADLKNKKLEFERMQALMEREAVASASRDSAEAAYRMAQETLRQAQEHYSLVMEGTRREDIDAARAELEQGKADLELARTRLSYATLISPANGVVLVRSAEPGEVVAIGSPVLTIGDLDNIYFEGYIPETDLAKARFGQRAAITTDTFPGREYPAWVSYISSKAEFTPKTVETFKERVTLVYRTKIRTNNQNYELKPGMPAEAVIFLEGEQP
ncbi:MAG: efflux RND transporter periplasmic adaptor subunit [Deltaproteobacteria bacterium]|nr:efflux RND transporter periplasmic adaptor subunit [Deltaproteobacteria bacterium]